MHGDDSVANDCQPGSTDSRYVSVCNQCCPVSDYTGGPVGFIFNESTSAYTWDVQFVTETQELN